MSGADRSIGAAYSRSALVGADTGGATTPTWARLASARNAYVPRPTDVPAVLVTSENHEDWGVPPFEPLAFRVCQIVDGDQIGPIA